MNTVKYASEGIDVFLLTATRGDNGRYRGSPPEGSPHPGPMALADMREAELRAAASVLGVREVSLLGHGDQSVDRANPREAISFMVQHIRSIRPDVVVTFAPDGAYGHPDHIKINRATIAAFQQLQGEPEHPQKLYYTTGPRRLLRVGVTVMKVLGQNPRKAGINKDMDLQAAVEAMTPVTTRATVAGYVAPTVKAMRCHASQIKRSKVVDFFSPLAGRIFMRTTSLSRVYPEPKPGEHIERDVFQGI